jgi:hypothetical protein
LETRRSRRGIVDEGVEHDAMAFAAGPSTFDVTSLNLFEHCRFLKSVGRGLMVLIVGSLVTLSTHSVLSLAVLPGAKSQPGLYLVGLIYMGVISMICWCYWRTMMDDPGVVVSYEPFASQADGHPLHHVPTRLLGDASFRQHMTHTYTENLRSDMARAAKSAHATGREKRMALAYAYETRPRWCKKCNRWKPPRSHHCSMMGACVLKMDHYCVWMGNTIGLLNYRSFVLFLWWTFLGCAMSAVMLFRPSVRFVRGDTSALGPTASVERIVAGILGFVTFVFTAAFTLALIGFLVMHWSLMARNMTTIEAYEKRNVEPWPWNAGTWRENVGQVFGAGRAGPTSALRRWGRTLAPGYSAGERERLINTYGHARHTIDVADFVESVGMMEVV